MDCKTARLLLEFARPGAPELEAADAGALDAHLGGCPDCDALARAERRVDAHLGRAVRQVEVPADLKGRIRARLAADRHVLHLRWAGHGVRALAAAAAVLLAALGVQQWRWAHRPTPDVTEVWESANNLRSSPRDRRTLEEAFRNELGVVTSLPDLDYRLLSSYGLVAFQGERVPQLVFVRDDAPHAVRATVRVLSDRQFDLGNPPAPLAVTDPGYTEKVELEVRDGRRYADLIVYDSDGLEWLRKKGGEAAGN